MCLFRKIHINATRPLIKSCLLQINLQKQVRTRQDKLINSYYYADFNQNDVFFRNSFFPKITKLYDRIPSHIKNTYDFSEFKERLSIHLKPKRIKLFNYGSRYSNTLHTQLRLDRSQLNEHLFSIGLTNIKGCMCGHNTESTEHFLLNCFLYSYERNNLLSNLTGVLEKQPAIMTKENLLKALLMGERNDDRLKYKHNK